MSQLPGFDPSRLLTKVSGADYLEVKWRLVWLREAHPHATIATELVSHADNHAIFKATVTLPDGGSATGYGSEGRGDFREYIEKAETKAIGRALAALGFGTQFCPDFDFGAERGRVVDSPVDFTSTQGARQSSTGRNTPRPVQDANQLVTERQVHYIGVIAREVGLNDEELKIDVERLYGRTVDQLERKDASAYIESLQARRIPAQVAS